MEGTPTTVPTTGKGFVALAKSLLIAAVPITLGFLAAKMISNYVPKSWGGTKA